MIQFETTPARLLTVEADVKPTPVPPGMDVPVAAPLSAALDGLPHLVVIISAEGRAIWSNAFVARHFPDVRPSVDVAGLGWFTDVAAIGDALDAALRGQSMPVGGTARSRDGSIFVSNMVVSPLEPDGGSPRVMLFGVNETSQRRALRRLQVVGREIVHRSRNLFSVIQSVTAQTFAAHESPEEIRDALMARLQALSRCHAALVEADWSGIGLKGIARDELAAFGNRVEIAGPDVTLAPAAGQTAALVLHELGTNAAKHGALSSPTGRVELTWEFRDGRLELAWEERGGPVVTPPVRLGFGRKLIGRIAEQEFGHSPSVDFRPEGLVYRACLAADRLET